MNVQEICFPVLLTKYALTQMDHTCAVLLDFQPKMIRVKVSSFSQHGMCKDNFDLDCTSSMPGSSGIRLGLDQILDWQKFCQ